ncbi:T9SS type A sorting domain-containing protein [Dysgonomonas sp. 520]|uniref:T9SS type A sorting domain-containing protein n=1 Tax=Dysgonomonas sp. 520 TaxID=2302931 RepID=UPI0013D4EEF1|nr:T9SS type A sorting domain-containing protein [Dysgonomonas sp. 520]NDW10231.1 T9SS C-terminal target domain-containing protein [Dysgonomonas sp. 520]
MKFKAIFFGFLICAISSLSAQTPAFPGAEGGGMYTKGGRGGKVIYVTNLNDSGTGSLRAALTASGKRTVVFKVSGTIELKSEIRISNGYVTVAGQTAPGDGICVKNYDIYVYANEVIIRYMRFRLGDATSNDDMDAIWGRYQKNVILDHCSMSWSIDECASFYSNENFTMQWCYITESLNRAGHDKGDHGYGGIWGGKNASFHHNLIAHHNSRNPRFNGWKRSGLSYNNPMSEERLDFRNNVIYNWGANGAYGGESAGKYNIVANYYKYGPATKSDIRSLITQIDIDKDPTKNPPGYGQYYITDNYVYGNNTATNDNWNSAAVKYAEGVDKTACRTNQPFDYYPITQHTPQMAFERVLTYGGASLVRDVVDERIAREVRNGTYTYVGSETGKLGIIDSQNDVGSWPEYTQGKAPADSDADGIPDGWLNTNYPGKKSTDLNEEGYTYLEVYLNSIVEDITKAQLSLKDDENQDETKDLFCGSIPTDGGVPLEVSSLITNGSLSIENRGSKDACSENGYAWRTNDVTFTLPAKTRFSVNLTANGVRTVSVTINGNEAESLTYSIEKTSCQAISFNLDSDTPNTIRIQEIGGADANVFSMTDLCIQEILNSSIEESVSNELIFTLIGDMLYSDAKRIEIYSITGKPIVSSEKNQLYVGNLNTGIYIVRLIGNQGVVSTHKFIK